MSNYPVILIPRKIEEARSALPPVPVFSEKELQKPGKEPQKISYSILAAESLGTVIVTSILFPIVHIPVVLLFLVAAVAIAFHSWSQINTYPRRNQEYERRAKEYPSKMKGYLTEKGEHEKIVKALRSPEKVGEFQSKSLLQVLSQTIPPDNKNSKARVGKSEEKFGSYLKRYFPDKIQTGLKVQNSKYKKGYHYTPDFAYIDQGLKLYIDIEIDEPYSGGRPTHHVELQSEQVRDNHFNSRGWVVIRFSKEQVVRYPESCCKAIAGVIAKVGGDSTILKQFASVSDVQVIRRWTKKQAKQMALGKYRDKYG